MSNKCQFVLVRRQHSRQWDGGIKIMVCHLFSVKPLSIPMLEHCWLDLRNKLQGNFNPNSNIFIEEKMFENVVCKCCPFHFGLNVLTLLVLTLEFSSQTQSVTWLLTHWGRVMHICISKLTIISSDNGLSPDRRQAIIWTNAGLLLFGPLGTNFSEILIAILTFSFKKMCLKVSSAKRWPFCLGLNVLMPWLLTSPGHQQP